MMDTDSLTRRYAVLHRDKGVCQLCDRNCKKLRERMNERETWYSERGRYREFIDRLRRIGWPFYRSLWDCDHIVPIIEGGAPGDLDNLRTLCLWCHKKETATLRGRMAKREREAKREAEPQQRFAFGS